MVTQHVRKTRRVFIKDMLRYGVGAGFAGLASSRLLGANDRIRTISTPKALPLLVI